MGPVLSLVGRSGVGKTTFLVQLIRELVARGYRIAALKHTCHGLDWDRPDSDTDRFTAAGAGPVVFCGRDFCAGTGRFTPQALYLLGLSQGADLVLVEGFKDGPFPRLEVVRSALSRETVVDPGQLTAVIADIDIPGLQVLPLHDAKAVADWMVSSCMQVTPCEEVPTWIAELLRGWLAPGSYRLNIVPRPASSSPFTIQRVPVNIHPPH